MLPTLPALVKSLFVGDWSVRGGPSPAFSLRASGPDSGSLEANGRDEAQGTGSVCADRSSAALHSVTPSRERVWVVTRMTLASVSPLGYPALTRPAQRAKNLPDHLSCVAPRIRWLNVRLAIRHERRSTDVTNSEERHRDDRPLAREGALPRGSKRIEITRRTPVPMPVSLTLLVRMDIVRRRSGSCGCKARYEGH